MTTHEYEVKVIGGVHDEFDFANYGTDSFLDFTDWLTNSITFFKSAIMFNKHIDVTFMIEVTGKHSITAIDLVKQKTGEVSVIEH